MYPQSRKVTCQVKDLVSLTELLIYLQVGNLLGSHSAIYEAIVVERGGIVDSHYLQAGAIGFNQDVTCV
jgi:hypothetical protein